jgi:hypothetical protein
MTHQYVVGEMSLLLARLHAAAGSDESAAGFDGLRLDAERRAPWDLADIEIRALALADALCWQSLHRGDCAAFERQSAIAADLLEFGVCAGILSGF